jgi:dihydrofolate reductase
MDKNRGIGKNNSMPWHLPKELAYFKEITKGHVVVFGRNTWESLPKKPLPDRKNAVFTRDLKFHVPQVWAFHELEDIFWIERMYGYKEVFICGGANVYKQLLPHADRIFLTVIDAEFECDTFFPEFNHDEWNVVSSEEDTDNGYSFKKLILEK